MYERHRSSRKYYYYQIPIGDRHAWSETWHAWSETSTCLNRDLDMLNRRLTCLIGEPPETDMPDWRPRHASSETDRHVGFRWVTNETCRGFRSDMSVTDGECQLPLGHVGLWWVSDLACRGLRFSMSRSFMGLLSGMSLSYVACLGLWWVSDEACRGLRWVSKQACRSPM